MLIEIARPVRRGPPGLHRAQNWSGPSRWPSSTRNRVNRAGPEVPLAAGVTRRRRHEGVNHDLPLNLLEILAGGENVELIAGIIDDRGRVSIVEEDIPMVSSVLWYSSS